MLILCSVQNFGYYGVMIWMPSYLSTPVRLRPDRSRRCGPAVTILRHGVRHLAVRPYSPTASAAARRSCPTRPAPSSWCWSIRSSTTPTALLIGGAVMGMFVNGMIGGYGALMSELYPTEARATAQNVLFNIGRAVGGFGPLVVGALATELFVPDGDRAAGLDLCAGHPGHGAADPGTQGRGAGVTSPGGGSRARQVLGLRPFARRPMPGHMDDPQHDDTLHALVHLDVRQADDTLLEGVSHPARSAGCFFDRSFDCLGDAVRYAPRRIRTLGVNPPDKVSDIRRLCSSPTRRSASPIYLGPVQQIHQPPFDTRSCAITRPCRMSSSARSIPSIVAQFLGDEALHGLTGHDLGPAAGLRGQACQSAFRVRRQIQLQHAHCSLPIGFELAEGCRAQPTARSTFPTLSTISPICVLGDDQRRRERDGVAGDAEHQADVVEGALHRLEGARADGVGPRGEVDGADEADGADVDARSAGPSGDMDRVGPDRLQRPGALEQASRRGRGPSVASAAAQASGWPE